MSTLRETLEWRVQRKRAARRLLHRGRSGR